MSLRFPGNGRISSFRGAKLRACDLQNAVSEQLEASEITRARKFGGRNSVTICLVGPPIYSRLTHRRNSKPPFPPSSSMVMVMAGSSSPAQPTPLTSMASAVVGGKTAPCSFPNRVLHPAVVRASNCFGKHVLDLWKISIDPMICSKDVLDMWQISMDSMIFSMDSMICSKDVLDLW